MADDNYLEGMAVVSFPACENAVALELVASLKGKTDEHRKGEQAMKEMTEPAANEVTAEVTDTAEQNAEAEKAAAQTETAETAADNVTAEGAEKPEEDEEPKEDPEDPEDQEEPEQMDETGACKEKQAETAEAENASLCVDEVHREEKVTDVWDDETCEGVTVVETTEVRTHQHIGEEETAEAQTASEETVSAEQAAVEDAPVKEQASIAALAEKLSAAIEEGNMLKKAVAELRDMLAKLTEKPEKVIASEALRDAEEKTNPFMADISAPNQYSLLEKETENNSYTLL